MQDNGRNLIELDFILYIETLSFLIFKISDKIFLDPPFISLNPFFSAIVGFIIICSKVLFY